MTKYYNEIAKATNDTKENDRIALILRHKIDRALAKKLSEKTLYSVKNNLIQVSHG